MMRKRFAQQFARFTEFVDGHGIGGEIADREPKGRGIEALVGVARALRRRLARRLDVADRKLEFADVEQRARVRFAARAVRAAATSVNRRRAVSTSPRWRLVTAQLRSSALSVIGDSAAASS